MRGTICAFLIVGTVCSVAHAQQAAPSAVPVGTVAAQLKSISPTLDLVGRVEAVNRVEIKARVTGYLDAVLFKEGDIVKDGDPLYRIEKGLFEASVQQAQGNLERSKSAKILTEIQLQRAEELLTRAAGTVVARDQAQAADQQAKGSILTDEANLSTAKINLGYTEINAPITGKIGRTRITKGNVVGPDSGPLTMIVSQDPMYVTFPVSQREFLKAEEAGRRDPSQGLKVRIRFSDGTLYDQTGVINFVDVSVDRTTDTVTARATMPNPKGSLVDGQLVKVVLEGEKPQEKVVVPQAALIADQQGVYVFVVEDGKAAVRRLKLGGESGVSMIVEQGLSPGDQVIVEGLQGVRPGVPVRANPMPSSLERS